MGAGLNSGLDWKIENRCAVGPAANELTSPPTERERKRTAPIIWSVEHKINKLNLKERVRLCFVALKYQYRFH